MGSKGNKVVKDYHFLWRKWGVVGGEIRYYLVLANLVLRAGLFMIFDCRLRWMHTSPEGLELLNLKSAC